MKIILATNNQGKVNELKSLFNTNIYSLNDLNIDIDIIEDGNTLEENAKIKATSIVKLFPNDIVIADDTGLFINSLNGRPGVYSARYAFDGCNNEDNIDKILEELANFDDRSAFFKTVIVLYKNNEYYYYDGVLHGEILKSRSGSNGFGYDSVFYNKHFNKSLASLTKAEKNCISHRSLAIKKLINSKII
ncbi:MAG: RdgB/HAM1 family non-canonical purine NTP pyrophosphatase [Bacilli bacterium]